MHFKATSAKDYGRPTKTQSQKSWKFFISMILVTFISPTSWSYAAAVSALSPKAQFDVSSDKFQTEMIEFVQAASANVFIRDWLTNELGNQVRHELDFLVNEALRAHPFVKKMRAEILQALTAQVEDTKVKLLGDTALAQEKPYPMYPKLAQTFKQVLEKMYFPQASIDNAMLFIAQSSDVNAFTYVPSPFLDAQAVFFTGLLEITSPQEAAAVMSHEAAHIYLGHVFNSVMLNLVFNELGEILIPETNEEPPTPAHPSPSEDPEGLLATDRQRVKRALGLNGVTGRAQLAAFKEMIRNETRRNIMASLGSHCHGTLCTGSAHTQALASQVADRFTQVTERLHRDLKQKGQGFGSETASYGELKDLAMRLGSVLTAADEEEMPEGTPNSDNEKPFKKFQRLMAELSQSQETSCDRAALVTISPTAISGAMSRLMGGTGANVQAIIHQTEIKHQILARQGVSVLGLEDSSHPSTASRVRHYEAYVESPYYKISADSFLRALDLYFRLTSQLTNQDLGIASRGGKLAGRQVLVDERKQFTLLARNLSNMIATAVAEDFTSEEVSIESPPTHLFKLVEYLGVLSLKVNLMLPWEELSRPDRVLSQVIHNLENLKGEAEAQRKAKIAANMLRQQFQFADTNLYNAFVSQFFATIDSPDEADSAVETSADCDLILTSSQKLKK